MKQKKGFTLIELLAVILILGIIALIAIPTVTNIINESKRGAFKSSVQNVINAVETQCQLEQLNGNDITKTYTFNNGKVDKNLNVKGDLPKSGTITVDNDCNTTVDVSDGTFTATKAIDTDEIEISETGKESEEKDDSYYAELGFACKRANILHTVECTSDVCKEAGYTVASSKDTTIITYGNLGTKGNLTSGDAFDCDVNNDGKYDSETERFYYVSDYYNTTTKEFETDKATLIYYNNTKTGLPDNTLESSTRYSSSKTVKGPTDALPNLPLRTQWTNENLITGTRAIIAEGGETVAKEFNGSTNTYALPTAFDYSNYAARLLTAQELNVACGITVSSQTTGELDNCNYLMENTRYSSSSITRGYWLETPQASYVYGVWVVLGSGRSVSYHCADNSIENGLAYIFGARPAITLLKTNISY